MLLFFMNVLWQLETKEFSRGASLLASNLEKIFVMLWMRLMGLKSVTLVASVFLGRRMMHAEFSHSKPWAFNVNRLFMAAITSSLMISQRALKKAPVRAWRFVGRHGIYSVFLSLPGRKATLDRRDRVGCIQGIANLLWKLSVSRRQCDF